MAVEAGSPAVREITRGFKPGYTLSSGGKGGDHHFVIAPDGSRVRDEHGRPIRIPGSPRTSGPHLDVLARRLRKAGVLAASGAPPKRTRSQHEKDQRLARDRERAETSGEERVAATRALRERLVPLFAKVGGIERVKTFDLARVSQWVYNEQANGSEPWKIEYATNVASAFLNGKALHLYEIEKMVPLAERLEQADHPRDEWFSLMRETLGIAEKDVLPGRAWPFTVKLINLANLFADESYQRPVDDSFVRKLVLTFDERRVGTIDISDRGDNQYAIIDGLQRVSAMKLVGKTACYCSIYEGLTIPEEAALFYHKNRDRKYVHPYYHYRARVVAGDPTAIEIEKIVRANGFAMAVGAAKPGTSTENNLAGIRAIEDIYSYTSEHREEALSPTLALVRRCWAGREGATQAPLLKGLGRIFRTFADADIQSAHWEELLTALGPMLVLGRARDIQKQALHVACSIALVSIHNQGLPRGQRLDERLVRSWQVAPTGGAGGAVTNRPNA